MAHITGKTYGFGRVSPITRPSQFAAARESAAAELETSVRASTGTRARLRSAHWVRIVAVSAIVVVTVAFAILAFVSTAS